MTKHSPARDADIRAHVEAELAATPGLDAIHIAVTVADGHVRLNGRVASYPELRLAEQVGRNVTDVRDLTNEVTAHVEWGVERDAEIATQANVSSVGMLNAIEAALVRSSELQGQPIVVSAEGGHVTLTGTVRTWVQLQQASAAAWSAAGVTRVSNLLRLDDAAPRHETATVPR